MSTSSLSSAILIVSTLCSNNVVGFSPSVHVAGRASSAKYSTSEGVLPQVENVERESLATLPGDYGFDPFGLGKSDSFFALIQSGVLVKDKYTPRDSTTILRDYRDAELRHGRLAMLAALAWPVQELLSPTVARFANRELGITGLSDLLTETGGRSPSVLNGGLEQAGIPVFLAITAAAIASLDLASLRIKEREGDAYVPGNFGFDPLNLLGGVSPEGARDMQEKEVNNGRLAMIAVTAYVVEELSTGVPVVETTPWLFSPLVSTDFLDQYFAIASAAQRIPAEDVASMFTNAI